MNFYKHYIGDFQRDTGHLSLAERGAYRAMLDHYYATERPLPADVTSVARLVGAMDDVERQAVERVLRDFWVRTEGGFTNRRADLEIAKAAAQRETNREIGKRGGNPYLTVQYNEPGSLYAARLPDGRIKVGITAHAWSKRAHGLAKTHGGKPELLALVQVQDMGKCEREVLDRFAQFASGEVLSIPDDQVPILLAELHAKGEPIHQPNRVPNQQPITSPNQTPDTRHRDTEVHGKVVHVGESARGEVAPQPAVADATPSPPARRVSGSRIPDGFPDAEAIEWSHANTPMVDADREAATFRDYWLGKAGADGRKADWPATWRNWCRRSAEYAQKARASPRNGHDGRSARSRDTAAFIHDLTGGLMGRPLDADDDDHRTIDAA